MRVKPVPLLWKLEKLQAPLELEPDDIIYAWGNFYKVNRTNEEGQIVFDSFKMPVEELPEETIYKIKENQDEN